MVLLGKRPVEESLPVLGAVFADLVVGALKETLLVLAEVESLVDAAVERPLLIEPALLVLAEVEALVDAAVEGILLAEPPLPEDASRVLWALSALLEDVFRVLPEMNDDFPLDAAVFVTVKVAVDDLTVEVVVVSETLMQEHADEEPDTDEQITVGTKLDVVDPTLDMPLRHRLPYPLSSVMVAFRRVVAFWYLVELPAGKVKVVVIVLQID